MKSKTIRVLLVDDSITALEALSRCLESDQNIEIIGKVLDSTKVISQIKSLKPDIACIDYFMPGLSGLELTKKIMVECPLPILIVSGQLVSRVCKEIFSVLKAGALDFLPKTIIAEPDGAKTFIEKIRVLSNVYVIKRQDQMIKTFRPPTEMMTRKGEGYSLIIIGASTGGPTALASIFSSLPANFPVPIVCVQHISKGFLEGFADWITSSCALKVKIIDDQDSLEPGYVYLPQEDTHMKFNKHYQMLVSRAPPVCLHRPSIDVTMCSAASCFGKKVIAILLTGMGEDGARGMQEVFQSGGMTIAQSEATSIVFGMPKAAIDLQAVRHIMDLEDIGLFLNDLSKLPNVIKQKR